MQARRRKPLPPGARLLLVGVAALFACSPAASNDDGGTMPSQDSGPSQLLDSGPTGPLDSGMMPLDSGMMPLDSGMMPSADGGLDAGLGDAGPGTLTCAEVVSCLAACAGNQGCESACAQSGTTLGQSQFDGLAACEVTACPGLDGGLCTSTDPACDACTEEAVTGACASEYATCEALGRDGGADGGSTPADGGSDAGAMEEDGGSDAGVDGGSCTPVSDIDLCTSVNATCGTPSIVDNCGNSRTPDCGMCGQNATCDALLHFCSCQPGTSLDGNACVAGIGQSCAAAGSSCPGGQSCVSLYGVSVCTITGCATNADCGTNGNVANSCIPAPGGGTACQAACDPALSGACGANASLVCSTLDPASSTSACLPNCTQASADACAAEVYGGACDTLNGQCTTNACTTNSMCGTGNICFTDSSGATPKQYCVPDCRTGGACANGGACDLATGGCDFPAAGPLLGNACDPMVPGECGFPFPSNVFLTANSQTSTGGQVQFGTYTLPFNFNLQSYTDSSAWSDSDGFSPIPTILTDLPGATITGLPTEDTLASSLLTSSPTILLDTSTSPPTLVAHYAELDVTGNAGQQAFMIHPAARLKDGTRYIVAIRNVVDSTSTALVPNAVFEALRDGTASTDPTVAARRGLYANIFKLCTAAGITTTDLQIAWDFTTASTSGNTSQLVTMRDAALAALPAGGPAYTIVSAVDNPDGADTTIARRIYGTVHVPLFLDSGTVTIDADPTNPDLMTGYQLQRDANGLPLQNGFADFEFVVEIPTTVVNSGTPAPVLIQGHDLFSDRSEAQAADNTGYRSLLDLASNYQYVTVAVDLIGWRTPGANDGWPTDTNQENDQEKALGFVNNDIGGFRTMVDRGTQGMVNQLVAAYMMKTSFADDPNVLYTAGAPDPTNGTSIIDPAQVYYRGDGMGGILGTTYMALSKDAKRGVLGETGTSYSFIAMRSTNFAVDGLAGDQSFLQVLQGVYASSSEDVQLVLGLMQMHWDRLDASGFAPFVTTPITGDTPTHTVLIASAVGDFQVPAMAGDVLARSVGANNLAPTVRDVYGVTDVTGATTGNAFVEFDFGVENVAGVLIPETDMPPTEPSGAYVDPHDWVRALPRVWQATDTFFRQGSASNPCNGVNAQNECVFPLE